MTPTTTRSTLRPGAAVALLALLLAVALPPAGAEAGERFEAERVLFEHINEERRDRGLALLAGDGHLAGVARAWSEHMAAEGALSHNPALATEVTIDWAALGEIVGYGRRHGASVSELAVDRFEAFMASPAHRASIVGAYDRVGVGAVIDDAGRLWVTAVFAAVRAGAPPPEPHAADPQAHEAGEAAVARGLAASAATFADGGAEHVVLARAELFADALAGAPLAGGQGPILFTPGADVELGLRASVAAEIARVLPGQGTVYLLGGERALSAGVERELATAGYDVERIAGADRVATALAIAEVVVARDGAPEQVAIARDCDWADAAVGGAWAAHAGAPVLLTSKDGLDDDVAAFLAAHQPASRVGLGGPKALAGDVVDAAEARRVAGADRAATSVAIAEELWDCTPASPCAGVHLLRGDGDHAWASALAAAAASVEAGAPQLLVADHPPEVVATYLTDLGLDADAVTAAEDVPDDVLEALRQPLY